MQLRPLEGPPDDNKISVKLLLSREHAVDREHVRGEVRTRKTHGNHCKQVVLDAEVDWTDVDWQAGPSRCEQYLSNERIPHSWMTGALRKVLRGEKVNLQVSVIPQLKEICTHNSFMIKCITATIRESSGASYQFLR